MVSRLSKRRYFPEAVSSSVLGRKFICDEDSRLTALGMFRWNESREVSKAISRGSRLDDWLKQRPKSTDEARILKNMDKLIEAKENDGFWRDKIGLGASRIFKGTEVISHFDDFHCYHNRTTGKKDFWLTEYKGLTSPSWVHFEAPAAQVQVAVSQWVWEPIFKGLGWNPATETWVEFYDMRDNTFLERRKFIWFPDIAEDILCDAFDLYSGHRPPIPPRRFKCRNCNKLSICSIPPP